MPVTIAELEAVAAKGWRAPEEARLGEWLLRAAEGFTGRANSALAARDPAMPLDAALRGVRTWYHATARHHTRPPADIAHPPGDDVIMTGQHHGGFAGATYVDHRRPDGLVVRWESRHHRKHLPAARADDSTWWAPQARGWWIAILFAVGSVLFALGSVPGYASAVGARWDSVTYFIGSLFFTSAAFLTYREAVDAAPGAQDNPAHRRFFVYQSGRIDWWATAVQFAGTLYFNVSTGVAVSANLTAQAAHQHVWRPDAIGSVCFLVASLLAWFEVCHGWAAWRPRSWSWWITLLNLLGSVAFGVSAVAGYISPVSGQVRNLAGANLTTFIGAVCFLAGAVLLLPERTEHASGQAAAPGGSGEIARQGPPPVAT